jgi:hypothetical protein
MKAVASDEERHKQLDLKKKREEQARREAEERERENELRELKKQEREKRRALNEQRRQETLAEDGADGESTSASQARYQHTDKAKRNRGFIRSRMWTLFFVSVFMFVAFNLLFSNFCDKPNRSAVFKSGFLRQPALLPFFEHLEKDACPRFYEFDNYAGISSVKRFVANKIAQLNAMKR